jgi:hypothetical protein
MAAYMKLDGSEYNCDDFHHIFSDFDRIVDDVRHIVGAFYLISGDKYWFWYVLKYQYFST